MPHGGIVFRSGITGNGTKQSIEFSLNLESNPEFTASVLVAFTRAVGKMAREGQTGARTVFDIPLGYLSPKSAEELRRTLL
jgi:diaminopimelate dehydrogenase